VAIIKVFWSLLSSMLRNSPQTYNWIDASERGLYNIASLAQWRRQRTKEPGHLRSEHQGHPDAPFLLKKVDVLFLVVALKTQRPPTPLRRLFHFQNKTNKAVRYRYFYILFTLLPKQSKAIGRAEPGRCTFQPGHLTWRALVYWRSYLTDKYHGLIAEQCVDQCN